MGASAVLTLAAEGRVALRRIVERLVAPNMFRHETNPMIADAVAGQPVSPGEPVGRLRPVSQPTRQDREALSACMRSPRPPLDDGRLSKGTVHVLVVRGDKDFAGPADPISRRMPMRGS